MFRKHDQNSSGGKFALQLRLPSGISRKSPRFLLLEEAEVGKIHLRGGVGGGEKGRELDATLKRVALLPEKSRI